MNTALYRSATGSALFDLAETTLKARALHSWNDRQKEVIRTLFARVHSDWNSEWMPMREGLSLRVVAEVEVAESNAPFVPETDEIARWSFGEAPPRAVAAFVADSPPRVILGDAVTRAVRAIADRIFSLDSSALGVAPVASAIVSSVAQAAWNDWLRRLGALLKGVVLEEQWSGAAPDRNELPGPWSGALHVRWSWCGGVWCLGLPHAVVAGLLGADAEANKSELAAVAPGAPKACLDHALAGQYLALRVMLEGADLSLGQLLQLRLDDVIPLDHLLDSPAHVIGANGAAVCHGWLGRSADRIAVELAVLPIPNPNTTSSKERTS